MFFSTIVLAQNPLIAHRGASSYAPENTLSAFGKAMEMGAAMIVTDVHQTKITNYPDILKEKN
jgi:glycerophosphoryl diester phosphodiesterase